MASVLLHVLALAGAAAAAPELVSVLEAFDGPADAVDVFGPPGPFSPGTLYEDLDASFPGDEIRNKPTPDFRPGTSGLPRVAQRGRSVARSAARPSMLSSLRSSLSRSTKNSRHSSSDTQNHGLSPLSTSRSLPQALTRDSSLGGSSSKSPNSLVWTASAPRPVVPPSPHNEDRV